MTVTAFAAAMHRPFFNGYPSMQGKFWAPALFYEIFGLLDISKNLLFEQPWFFS